MTIFVISKDRQRFFSKICETVATLQTSQNIFFRPALSRKCDVTNRLSLTFRSLALTPTQLLRSNSESRRKGNSVSKIQWNKQDANSSEITRKKSEEFSLSPRIPNQSKEKRKSDEKPNKKSCETKQAECELCLLLVIKTKIKVFNCFSIASCCWGELVKKVQICDLWVSKDYQSQDIWEQWTSSRARAKSKYPQFVCLFFFRAGEEEKKLRTSIWRNSDESLMSARNSPWVRLWITFPNKSEVLKYVSARVTQP